MTTWLLIIWLLNAQGFPVPPWTTYYPTQATCLSARNKLDKELLAENKGHGLAHIYAGSECREVKEDQP